MTVNDLAPELAPQLAEELGLKRAEYHKIVEILERVPTATELYMYSLMWSEHCTYKNSGKQLRNFPTGVRVLRGPARTRASSHRRRLAVAFKMESHNHPSAPSSPTRGRRPAWVASSATSSRWVRVPSRSLTRCASGRPPAASATCARRGRGIGGYGNCLGVPTVGGELYFDPPYEGNSLVNAMSIGLMREENLTRATATGPGNVAPLRLDHRPRRHRRSERPCQPGVRRARRGQAPAVQVGDPFEEKLLIEACLELLDKKLARRSRRPGCRRPHLERQRDGVARRRWARYRRHADSRPRARDAAASSSWSPSPKSACSPS